MGVIPALAGGEHDLTLPLDESVARSDSGCDSVRGG